MLGIENLYLFIITGIILNLTPGPDTFYILAKSIAHGKKAGLLSVFGIATGSLVHTFLAAFGISLILKESEMAFTIIKHMGALYLIYLGVISIYKTKQNLLSNEFKSNKEKNSQAFYSGILTNVLNPKVALFFLAFLPQFISPENNNPTLAFIFLGLCFTFTGTIWCVILAFFSSSISEKIKQNPSINIIIQRLTGLLFICLGINLAKISLK